MTVDDLCSCRFSIVATASIAAHHQLLLLLQDTVLHRVTCALEGLPTTTVSSCRSSLGSTSNGSSGNGSRQAGSAASSSIPAVSSSLELELLQAAGKVACLATKDFLSALRQLKRDIPGLPLKLLQRMLKALAQSMIACAQEEPPSEQYNSDMHASQKSAADSASGSRSSCSAASSWEEDDSSLASRLGKLRHGERNTSNLGCIDKVSPAVPCLMQGKVDEGLGPVPVERVLLVEDISKAGGPAACTGGSWGSWDKHYQGVSSLLQQLLGLEGLPPELQQKASVVGQLEQEAAIPLKTADRCNPKANEVELYLQLAFAEGSELMQLLQQQQQQQQQEEEIHQLQQDQLQQQLHHEQQDQRQTFRVPPELLKQLLLVLHANEDRCRTAADLYLQQHLETYRAWWEKESLNVVHELVSAKFSAGAASWKEVAGVFAAADATVDSSSESLSVAQLSVAPQKQRYTAPFCNLPLA